MTKKIRISDAALDAARTYVIDPCFTEDDGEDGEVARAIAAGIVGQTLTVPTGSGDRWAQAWTDGANSADEDKDYSWARALGAVARKLYSY